MTNQIDKAAKISISLPQSQITWLESLGGKKSSHIQKLIDQQINAPTTANLDLEKPLGELIHNYAPLIEHLYHKAYEVNGGPPENFDERLLLKCLLEQSLHLIAKHYEQDFRACTDIDLSSLIDQAKDFTTFQERARLATDYVRRPESIAAAADHNVITQKGRQKAKTKYPPEFYPEYTPNAKPKLA